MEFLAIVVSLVLLAAATPADAAQKWRPVTGHITTKWAAQVGPSKSHPEYPRPMMVRKEWLNLNGLWDFEITGKEDDRPADFGKTILVPFPAGSALSGIGHMVRPSERIWYRREFSVPRAWSGKRVLLNFGAVDWETTVWVNGKEVGRHKGGYDPFTFDITNALSPSGKQQIILTVWDPSNEGGQPVGKQVLNPGGCSYTPSAGIWQTVWLEPVNTAHVISHTAIPDVDRQLLRVTVEASGVGTDAVVTIVAADGGREVSRAEGKPGAEIVLPLPNAKLWSPDSPFLYDLSISLADRGKVHDTCTSYFGMRKISVKKDDAGIPRLALNNQILFQYGPLDQGFWPDGLYLAPTDEALRYDLEFVKRFGGNMIRKHVKVEPQRLYYWADKLGVLVWQDMPNGADKPELRPQFADELSRMVESLRNHPSIVMWVIFNEGWGQHDTSKLVEMVWRLDPSRLVNEASGWADQKAGDVIDHHVYPGPGMPPVEAERPAVLGEFGGVGGTYLGHYWKDSGNFAYVPVLDITAATDAYVKMLAELPSLISKGLSAAVYTQITDVEVEVNGWMTYDRALPKIDVDTVADMTRRLYGPAPEQKTIVPCALESPRTWRYTNDLPQPSWVEPAFDDSNWKEGLAGFGAPNIQDLRVGTEWLTADVWIRLEFKLDEVPQFPHLKILHDDDAVVYINGEYLTTYKGPITGYRLQPLFGEAAKSLKVGENLIAIWCRNFNGPQGVDCGLTDLIPSDTKETKDK